jgi:hypothetical protein
MRRNDLRGSGWIKAVRRENPATATALRTSTVVYYPRITLVVTYRVQCFCATLRIYY